MDHIYFRRIVGKDKDAAGAGGQRPSPECNAHPNMQTFDGEEAAARQRAHWRSPRSALGNPHPGPRRPPSRVRLSTAFLDDDAQDPIQPKGAHILGGMATPETYVAPTHAGHTRGGAGRDLGGGGDVGGGSAPRCQTAFDRLPGQRQAAWRARDDGPTQGTLVPASSRGRQPPAGRCTAV